VNWEGHGKVMAYFMVPFLDFPAGTEEKYKKELSG
jgi:hypothetical protein